MALGKKKNKMQFAEEPVETNEVDTKELVYNMEDVRNAVRICLDFGKENNVELINPKGKAVVADMYRKYEAQNKVIRVVDERIEKRLAPIERKQDQIMQFLQNMADKTPAETPVAEPRKEQKRRQIQEPQQNLSEQTT